MLSWEDFKYLRYLGSGAHGSVHLCQDRSTHEHVAIKIVEFGHAPPHNLLDPSKKSAQQCAINEVGLLGQLDHPNIIRYRNYFVDAQERMCIIMDYADGGDLLTLLEADTELDQLPKETNTCMDPIPGQVVWDLCHQLLCALQYLSKNHILHRDIKPGNIFLSSTGCVMLGDFGVAKLLSPSTTHAETFIGTAHYIAPEICHGASYHHSSDVWSTGVVMYEMLTGTRPFTGNNLLALVQQITDGTFDWDLMHRDATRRSIPTLARVIDCMLIVDPVRRYTAQALLDEFFTPLMNDSPTIQTRVESINIQDLQNITFLQSVRDKEDLHEPSFNDSSLRSAHEFQAKHTPKSSHSTESYGLEPTNHENPSFKTLNRTEKTDPSFMCILESARQVPVTWSELAHKIGVNWSHTAQLVAQLLYDMEQHRNELRKIDICVHCSSIVEYMHIDPDTMKWRQMQKKLYKLICSHNSVHDSDLKMASLRITFLDEDQDEITLDGTTSWRYALRIAKSRHQILASSYQSSPIPVSIPRPALDIYIKKN